MRHIILISLLIFFIFYSLSESVDFSQCYATVLKKNSKQAVNDYQCSLCAEGVSDWPCNTSEICDCLTSPPSLPLDQYEWQRMRTNTLNELTEEMKLALPSGETKVLSKEAICGILGNIAVNTKYTFDYTKSIKDNTEYGLFNLASESIYIYFDFIRFKFQMGDSLKMQIRYIAYVINKYFDWLSIEKTYPIPKDNILKLYDAMTNKNFPADQQSDNFMMYYHALTPETAELRRLSARHCYFRLTGNSTAPSPIIVTTTVPITTSTTTSTTTATTKKPIKPTEFIPTLVPMNGVPSQNNLSVFINYLFILISFLIYAGI